ncbi:MAG: hypothetical protein M0Z59_03075 [Nitrospiraceae bacterium]|nr:hypothetical protein [Nitrospiraceae bacterium]
MVFPLEAVTTIGGLILPPVFDIIKKAFIKKGDGTAEATLNCLAETKPDALPGYVEANAKLMQARTEWFNRDVIGQASRWVVDLRAAIRPVTVCMSMCFLGMDAGKALAMDPSTRAALLFMVASWFGGRLK